jgi:alpha-tubulin suppressor-like RCC1 family protein
MHAGRIVLAAVLLAACREPTRSSPPASVEILSGNGQAATVAQAAPNPLVVRVADADGDPVKNVTVQWAVSSGGGSLSAATSETGSDGLAQVQWTLGPRAEAQTVTATVQGLAPAVFTMTPAAGPVARVVITPDSAEVAAVNQTAALGASFTDAYGNPAGQPGSGTVVWTSLDPAVAHVSGSSTPGQVYAFANAGGRARIEARSGTMADTAIFWVRQQAASVTLTLRDGALLSEGDTTRATAVVRDANGHVIPNATVTWSTSDPAGATVDAAGKITTLRGDTLNVVATSGTATGTATLYVSRLFRVASLDAGGHHGCALDAAGQAYCWGWNKSGQLGVPFTPATVLNLPADNWSAVPVAVQTSARFTAVSASAWPDPQPQASQEDRGHSCGIATDHSLLCWGQNAQGQLGSGGTSQPWVPAEVRGGRSWSAVSTGGRHTCGITTGGETYCWGLDNEGQVGAPAADVCQVNTTFAPTQPCTFTPQPLSGGPAFTRISAGTAHTCALTAGGAAYCWGRNTSGQLGNGTTTQADVPVAVLGGHTFVEISAGGAHTCARTGGGTVYCWGANGSGQLGTGGAAGTTSPVAVGGSFSSVEAGWAHTCARGAGGAALCWGANDQGQLGNGTLTGSSMPTPATGGFAFASVSTAGIHTCGVRTDGAALCWGDNAAGKLGYGSGPDRPFPRPVRAP